MKERPILFSAPMVRAILDGSKTQTRRIVKPQPPANTYKVMQYHHKDPRPHFFAWVDTVPPGPVCEASDWAHLCPYGQPGDHLWVRETWCHQWDEDANGGIGGWNGYLYRADGQNVVHVDDSEKSPWKPSIHMPRDASRILLEVTRVRAERLQDISEADAVAEGISIWHISKRHGIKWHCPEHIQRFGEGSNVEDVCFEGRPVKDPREAYRGVWSSINSAGSWEANPWVWVIEFKKVQP